MVDKKEIQEYLELIILTIRKSKRKNVVDQFEIFKAIIYHFEKLKIYL